VGAAAEEAGLTDRGPDEAERRAEPRVGANLRCWLERESVTLYGTTVNVSRGGVFLRTLPRIPQGSEVEIRIMLAKGPVIARGRIAWTSDPTSSGGTGAVPGLGICFTEVIGGDELLACFLDEALSREPIDV